MHQEVDFLSLPQPVPPPPRQVRRRRGWLLGAIPWWGWPILGFTLVCLTVVLGRLAAAWGLALLGVVVPGKVLGVVPPPGPGQAAYVQFEYHVAGQPYRKEAAVAERFLSQIGPGAQVRVRVWSRWPAQAQLLEPPELASPATTGWWLAASLSSVISVGLTWHWLRGPLAQRALVRKGIATPGRIVQLDTDNSAEVTWVHVCYQAPRHGLLAFPEVPCSSVAQREWQVVLPLPGYARAAVHAGMAVTVLYNPRQPHRSLIYLFADYEAIWPSLPSGAEDKK